MNVDMMDRRYGFLVVTWGPNKGTVIPLKEGQRLWIGRRNEFLPQADSRMSRIHFRLKPHSGGWIIEDQRSSNGTFLNGKPIHQPHLLRDGDLVQAGRTLLAFCRISAEDLQANAMPPQPEPEVTTHKSEFWPKMFRRRRPAAAAAASNQTDPDPDDSPPRDAPENQHTPEPASATPTGVKDDAPADEWKAAIDTEMVHRNETDDEPVEDGIEMETDDKTTPRTPKKRKKGRTLAEDEFNSTVIGGATDRLGVVLKTTKTDPPHQTDMPGPSSSAIKQTLTALFTTCRLTVDQTRQ